ncbi:hypothetical protein [Nodosilinea sp. FACHB-13]|nr:hypothetical protein [Nodosilinea sp. FACHB-13]
MPVGRLICIKECDRRSNYRPKSKGPGQLPTLAPYAIAVSA